MLGQIVFRYNSANNSRRNDRKDIVLQSYQALSKEKKAIIKKKKIDEVIHTLCDGWMPINEKAYNKIRKNLSSGVYDNDNDKLVCDITDDFTVLALIFRELPIVLETTQEINPIEFIRNADVGKLKKIFSKNVKDYSNFLLSDMQEAQAIMYKYVFQSACFSQVYAIQNSVDTLSSYSISVLKGLVNCLFSWNYPKVFFKALKAQVNRKSSLDDFMKKAVGVSSKEVTLGLLDVWNFDSDIKDFFYKNERRKSPLASKIIKCVENGEEMAMMQEPSYFPNVIEKIDAIASEIKNKKFLGMIKNEVKKTSEYYKKYSPAVFNLSLSTKEKIREMMYNFSKMRLENNSYAMKCSDEIIKSFQKVYLNIFNKKFSKRALEILIYETVPNLGFGNGCLYAYSDIKEKLTPILKFGNKDLMQYKEIGADDNQISSNTIYESLMCNAPIIKEAYSAKDFEYYICCSFGGNTKKGVLYLEIPNNNQINSQLIIGFKAVLQCLNECLGYL